MSKPFKSVGKELGRAGDSLIEGISGGLSPDMPEIDTSAQQAALRAQNEAIKRQEAAAQKAAEQSRKAADQAAQNARWQAEGAAQQFVAQQQREQLQQAATESAADALVTEQADVQVGDATSAAPERAKRRSQFQASGTSSKSPSIRI